ncbi:MAG: NUDIX hydrolase [Thermoplasmataceae archaeon]
MVKTCITVSAVLIEGNMVVLEHNQFLKRYMLIGDHQNEGETPEMALKRIVKEKIGHEIEIINYFIGDGKIDNRGLDINPITVLVENITYPDGQHHHLDMIFLARIIKSADASIGKNENIRWSPINNLGSEGVEPKVIEVIERGSSFLFDKKGY